MQRREFLTASAAAAMSLALPKSGRAADSATGRQLIEVRTYHFASPEKQSAFEQFLATVSIPAFNRAGIEPVGVFKLLAKDNPALKLTADSTDLYVILPYKSVESMIALEDKLAADGDYQKAGAGILNVSKSDPAYTRYESSLLYAFEQFPQLQVPNKSEGRLIQLRTYESFSRERALKKLRMFQQGGELGIFSRSGMTGVFFGEALIGAKLPNLTYMLSFESDEAQKKGWNAFRDDPDWKKLSKDEEYKDTVTTITNLLLRPAAGSQI
jgi:hypothetical protein